MDDVAPATVEEEPPLLNGHAEPADAAPPEPVSAPVSPPTLVGEAAPDAEKKRGWWRR